MSRCSLVECVRWREIEIDVRSCILDHDGVTYELTCQDGEVVMYRFGQWWGSGVWTGERIEDCAADAPDEVYDAFEQWLRETGK